MRATQDDDQILRAWLEEGPTVLPAPTVRAIEVATRAAAQQRPAIGLPWRSHPMPFPYKILSAAAVLAVVLVGSALLLGPRGDQGTVRGTAAPSPTPSATLLPSSTPAPSTALGRIDIKAWTAYASSQYGFTIGHPDDWTVSPADRAWNLDTDAADWQARPWTTSPRRRGTSE